MELSKQLSNIRIGHISLVICCAFYLAWWSVTFNPMKSFSSLPKYLLFLCIIMAVIILAAAIVSMICYLKYYNLEPVTGFYDGMVPLILFALVMATQAGLIRVQ